MGAEAAHLAGLAHLAAREPNAARLYLGRAADVGHARARRALVDLERRGSSRRWSLRPADGRDDARKTLLAASYRRWCPARADVEPPSPAAPSENDAFRDDETRPVVFRASFCAARPPRAPAAPDLLTRAGFFFCDDAAAARETVARSVGDDALCAASGTRDRAETFRGGRPDLRGICGRGAAATRRLWIPASLKSVLPGTFLDFKVGAETRRVEAPAEVLEDISYAYAHAARDVDVDDAGKAPPPDELELEAVEPPDAAFEILG